MDMFDLLEKVFRGIVYFVYNVVGTTAAVIRHPISGPRELLRAQNNPKVRQIGGLTYLFLLLIAFQALTVGKLASTGFFDTITKGPKLDTNAMWPEILAALIATVSIDAVVRLMLRWRLRGPTHSQFRQSLLSMAEFALFWMAGVSILLALLLQVNTGRWEQAGIAYHALLFFVGVPLVLILSAFPAAAILVGMATPLSERIHRRRRKIGLVMVGLTMLFIGAALIGTLVGYNLQSERDQEQESEKRLMLTTLRCQMLSDGRISADGLLSLPSGQAVAIDPDDLRLLPIEPGPAVMIFASDGSPVEWREPDPHRFILIEPAHDQLIEMVTRQPFAIPKSDKCALVWNEPGLSAETRKRRMEDDEGVDVVGGEPPRQGLAGKPARR